jgi:hypothetical protein
MKIYDKINCFCCDKELDNMHYESRNKESYVYVHPMGGLHFRTYGHYGSAVYDPMDGSSLDLAICDECVMLRKDKIRGTGKHFEHLN